MNQDNDSISFDDEPISIEDNDEPISIIGDDEPIIIEDVAAPVSIAPVEEEPLTISEGSSGRSISHTRGGTTLGAKGHQFSRPMQQSGKGATRCRIFRSKISVPAVESLEEHINEWLDSDDIDVKDVGHMIGTMHGKSDEDNIIITVWY